ncbi:polynucleotide adenylyltransferase [Larsenimonas suaedae]|uniref:Polynucleotide adenylyltransferase n=1 Tax=Larsenimonas suaedae TaxID=1851019 RepID=A0ABU1GV87_9GAMM|nr:polynucleotide adenylyltransferase [Larsenimonas suaedae]MCM2971825.1 polynucleotide adenylyltransferase [Larsenimonas suaedae]MDR5895377.1 polynucleotide adenylyltransferase [Larsenimonas suaedae]
MTRPFDPAIDGLDVYLVGGAVRDAQLGWPVYDRDWVVVGATPETMQARGFVPVGKDFPVFLHPTTHEEYALARTERKSGRGYGGFTVDASTAVTLEEDLSRRDLTINAMAQALDGTLIDPYGGVEDCRKRLFRHVSQAFIEDPLRVVRLARFQARYDALGFQVAEPTWALLVTMVGAGELEALARERVWQETEKALGESACPAFFDLLSRLGALPQLMGPSVDVLALRRGMARQARHLSVEARWAALLQYHALPALTAVMAHMKVPKRFAQLAAAFQRTRAFSSEASLTASSVLGWLSDIDVWRKPERADAVLSMLALEADTDTESVLVKRLGKARQAAEAVSPKALSAEGYRGAAMKEALATARHRAIAQALDECDGAL